MFVVLFLISSYVPNVLRETEAVYARKEDDRVVMRLLSRLIRKANYKGKQKRSQITKRDGYPAEANTPWRD